LRLGNTIFLALGCSGQNSRPLAWARSLVSIGVFGVGCFCFSRIHKFLGGGKYRRTVAFSFFLQSILVAIAAAIVQGGVISGTYPAGDRPGRDGAELVVVAMLSFGQGGQIVNSRGLAVGEVPTVVITSLICDLVSDEKLFVGLTKNGKRNRRFLGFALTLLGGITGGWISKETHKVSPCLWFVFGIKMVITLYWVGFIPLYRIFRGPRRNASPSSA